MDLHDVSKYGSNTVTRDLGEYETESVAHYEALAIAQSLAEAVKDVFTRNYTQNCCNFDLPQATNYVQQEEDKLLTFENPACCICNGFYGPNFDDPVCATCHAFLFPLVVPEQQEIGSRKAESSDSDSGNDEPPENTMRNSSLVDGSPDWFGALEIPVPPVETLQQQLNRLTETNNSSAMNIEDLPNEVLMHMVTYMDEITLWGFSQVNTRWRNIILKCVSNDRWRYYLLHRFVFYRPTYRESNWFEVYSRIMNSCCCLRCVRTMAAQEVPIMEENPWREKRLRTEIKALKLDPLEGIQAEPLDELCFHWQASLQGPIGSPYEGGLFFLYIQVPYTYPMNPPVVRFLTRIFHPNISRHGDIGIDSIQHNWSLALTIGKVLISIQSLLTDPYCDVCMEPEIGRLYLHNRGVFEEQARLWTWKYAMHDLLPN